MGSHRLRGSLVLACLVLAVSLVMALAVPSVRVGAQDAHGDNKDKKGDKPQQQPVTRRISEPALDLLFEPAVPDGRELADHLRHPALA